MSNVRYNAGTMTIEVDGLDDVSAVLGDLRKKTPAVAKVAINATARQARKLMIAEAKARYAVNSAGKRFLVEFKSGHVGMVQRIVGTGRFHYTVRSGAPSTSDKMQTMGSPSAAAMHSTIWPEVEPEVELFLAAKLTERAEQVLARAKRKA